jgi:hypothetical protein
MSRHASLTKTWSPWTRPPGTPPDGLRGRYSDADDILLTPAQRERKAEAIAAYRGELSKLDHAYGIRLTDPDTLIRETFWDRVD